MVVHLVADPVNSHMLVLSTRACIEHGKYIVTDNLHVALAWSMATLGNITPWDFVQQWDKWVPNHGHYDVYKMVKLCLGMGA